MNWQTKEFLEERLNDIEDKLDLIMDKLSINDNEEVEKDEEEDIL